MMRKYAVRFTARIFVESKNQEDAKVVASKYLDRARKEPRFALAQPMMKTEKGSVPWLHLRWHWDVKPVKSFLKHYRSE
jgi:hypothetical protein